MSGPSDEEPGVITITSAWTSDGPLMDLLLDLPSQRNFPPRHDIMQAGLVSRGIIHGNFPVCADIFRFISREYWNYIFFKNYPKLSFLQNRMVTITQIKSDKDICLI